jgi:glycerol-3-phosphate dehydrogenase
VGQPAGWTARTPLPGGDFPIDGLSDVVTSVRQRWPFLGEATARRFARAYGTRVSVVLDGVRSAADLGRTLGADLTEAELHYLARHEWAVSAEDVVWRRSKLGLRLSAAEIEAVERAMGAGRAAAE